MHYLKYALDGLFTFMLFVSIGLFITSLNHEITGEITRTVEIIDFSILGGYYAFFAHGLHKARNKMRYCRQQWALILLFALPFFPIARLISFAKAKHILKIGTDTLWHLFGELGFVKL